MEDQTETTQAAPGISLNDLQTVINIIDVCTKRGAFEGGEIALVGTTREKLVAFVKANAPAAPEETAPETEAAE